MSVITSWMVLSCTALYTSCPILLAGTWKQYSKKAIPQLTRITIQRADDLNFRCPYQANVINTFEIVNIRIGKINLYINEPLLKRLYR